MTLDWVTFLFGAAMGFSLGMWIATEREARSLRRLHFGTAPGSAGEPRRLVDDEHEVATAIAPPSDTIPPEAIDRGTDRLLAMARDEGRELSREEARRQAMIMLMTERGLIED